MKKYYVYIIWNISRSSLYIGFTNNLFRRILEHKNKVNAWFTNKYDCSRLLYYEEYSDVREAISREKQLKKWSRKKKDVLIKRMNPMYADLALKYWM